MKNIITFKFNTDYRNVFKEGESVTIPLDSDITYIVGTNGSGKSTLLRAIRATKDSLFEVNKKMRDGMINSRIEYISGDIKDNLLEVDLGEFTHVYALDADADNPTDFLNAASAYGLLAGGGMEAMQHSRGETSANQFIRFINQFKKEFEKYKDDLNWKPLIILDEADEGLDLRFQLNFNKLLIIKFVLFAAKVIVVTHNPLLMFSNQENVSVFDIETKEITTPQEYVKKLTNKEIIIKDLKEEN